MFASEAFAVGASICIALSAMFIGELKGRVPLLQLTRWQLVASFAMTGLVSLVLGGWQTLGVWQAGMLAASGFVGIAVASTTYFAAIYAVGPRLTALLFSLSAPFSLALGYAVLGETVTPGQAAGVALVLAGILLAIGLPVRGRGPATAIPQAGIVFGVVTALGQAAGSLLARPAMADGVEPFTAMAVRSGFAALFFVAVLALPLKRVLQRCAAVLRKDTRKNKDLKRTSESERSRHALG
ncbi:DMT family transporter, partial [Ensifer soli]|uniref:DMT family transporter n=1 Tax=Ciceribacter sp. sgz301302 TaxID=3342379 RepID=UPI0035B85AD9